MVKKLRILFFKLNLFLVFIFLFSCNKIENKVEIVDGYMNIDEVEEDKNTKSYEDVIKENEAKKLKEINFGKYFEIDDKNMTDIKWQILYEDKNKKEALITTKYTLDYMEFHDKEEICTWETSHMRKFLNCDFYNFSFSDEEKSRILITHLDNTNIRDMRIEGGNATSDYIFLASVDEVEKYNITNPIYNQYVLHKIISKNDERKNEWWLRNNAAIKENKIIYSEDKKYNYSGSVEEKQNLVEGIDYDGANACKKAKIVRPLMWIKYDSEKNDILLNEALKENEPKEKLIIGKTASNVNLGMYQGENIDWAIVKKDGKKALLLSRYIIDALPYNESGEECTWKTSSIRKYINEDFYNTAFSEEKKNIYI